MSKRAMTEAAKQKKADAILDCAAAMFLAADYESVKMSAIAKKMCISNGILFVYFPTKQTLFFSLLMREYSARADAMEQLIKSRDIQTPQALFDVILDDLAQQLENTLYLRLESIRTAILEKNVDIRRFLALKMALYERLCTLAEQISIPGVFTPRGILDIFHVQTALIGGFQLASAIPEPMREQLLQSGMEAFVHDFKKDTLQTMRLYLQALKI
jgi:AcrR family transcriptional regulator